MTTRTRKATKAKKPARAKNCASTAERPKGASRRNSAKAKKPAKVKKPAKAKKAKVERPGAAKKATAKAKTKQPARTKASPAAPEPKGGIAPFTLIETSPGNFSLLLTAFDDAAPVFEAWGSDGGGYAWAAVAEQLVAGRRPDLAERFDLDPEASMFCAYGPDREGLHELGQLLAEAWRDHELLAAAAREADFDEWD